MDPAEQLERSAWLDAAQADLTPRVPCAVLLLPSYLQPLKGPSVAAAAAA